MDWKIIAGYALSALGAVLGTLAMVIVNHMHSDQAGLKKDQRDLRDDQKELRKDVSALEAHKAAVDTKLENIESLADETRKDVKTLLRRRNGSG